MNTARFNDILSRELAAMQQLATLLSEEFAAMGNGDSDALEALLQRKSALLEQLQRLADERSEGLKVAGVGNTQRAIEDWLKASGDGVRVWRDLLVRTREVQAHQQTNQTLLENLMRCNQRALDLLVRLANPEQTYQADGRTTGGFGSRKRGTA